MDGIYCEHDSVHENTHIYQNLDALPSSLPCHTQMKFNGTRPIFMRFRNGPENYQLGYFGNKQPGSATAHKQASLPKNTQDTS